MFFEKHKRKIIVGMCSLIIIVLMALSTLDTQNAFFVNNAVRTVFAPVQKGVTTVANGIGGFFNFVYEMNSYKETNTELTNRIIELETNYRDAESYKQENEQLKALLDLKENSMSDMDTRAAQIIGWSSDNWFDFYTIDKGSRDGIAKNDMVICENGLVGRIHDVGYNWSTVSTIINPSSSVGVRITRTGDVALAEGDLMLELDGYCRLSFINKDAQIVVGDIVETSGLGGVFSADIGVGRIIEIKTDESGINEYAVIEPLADLKNLHYVLVVKKSE